MINVLLVDEQWLTHIGIDRALRGTRDLRLVGAVVSPAEALPLLAKNSPPVNVVLLELVTRGEPTIEAITELKLRRPKVAVVVFSALSEHLIAVRAMEQGADGFVSKAGSEAELLEAIRVVASGRRYVSATVGNLLADRLLTTSTLTPRESQIVDLFGRGHRCTEIAELLALSPKTISAHKANAMRKLGTRSNADLVRWSTANRVA